MYATQAVRILKSRSKKCTEKDIIHVLDNLETDEDFEITDELIEEIKTLFDAPVDYEKEALKEANKKFNKNVKGIIDEINEDDNWEPSVPVDTAAREEWERIQDKLDIINNRYQEMK